MNLNFLREVKSGKPFDSIFMSAVLNSVPFLDDRRHILYILSALATMKSHVLSVSASEKQAGCQIANGREFLNESDYSRLQFKLDYEPRVTLADFSETPKMQKYHTADEWRDLWLERFEMVKVTESSNNVECHCRFPRPIDMDRLDKALEFEFNLPYPDGGRMGIVDEAKEAFREYLKINGSNILTK